MVYCKTQRFIDDILKHFGKNLFFGTWKKKMANLRLFLFFSSLSLSLLVLFDVLMGLFLSICEQVFFFCCLFPLLPLQESSILPFLPFLSLFWSDKQRNFGHSPFRSCKEESKVSGKSGSSSGREIRVSRLDWSLSPLSHAVSVSPTKQSSKITLLTFLTLRE